MSHAFDLLESDVWPRLRVAIATNRKDRMAGLLNVATLEGMRKEQGYIEALDWVLEEAKTKPPQREESDIYE